MINVVEFQLKNAFYVCKRFRTEADQPLINHFDNSSSSQPLKRNHSLPASVL